MASIGKATRLVARIQSGATPQPILSPDEQSEVDQATPPAQRAQEPKKVWKPEDIRALLESNDKAVGRALMALLNGQTHDEVATGETIEHNDIGFSAFDAPIMTSMAEWYRDKGFLTPKQLAWLRAPHGKTSSTRISKYSKQLVALANAGVK